MTTEIAQFEFPATGQAIRTIEIDGTPWFVAADVCAALGIANHRDALARLDADEKGVGTTDTLGGPQVVAIVSEPGLYGLTWTSRKAEAGAFRRWIKHDVLPAIRSTGAYSPRRLPDVTTPEGVLALAEMAAQTARDLIESEKARKEMEPKAIAFDAYLSADAGDRLVRQVAKELGLTEKDLRRFLLEQKVIFARQAPCGANQYDVYAAHAKHFKPVEKVVDHTWGSCAHYTLYVHPSGVEYIRRRLAAEADRYQAAIAATTPKGN
jgi:prophage antirepressor-like protein